MWVIEVERHMVRGESTWARASGDPHVYSNLGKAMFTGARWQVRDYLSNFRLRHLESNDTFELRPLFELEIQRMVQRVHTQPLRLGRPST